MAATIILASSSPRRKSLLEFAGYDVRVHPPDADETWPGGSVGDAVVELALRKLARIEAVGDVHLPRLAADTVVYDGEPLGKPDDASDATRILTRLSGRDHTVVTGFVVRQGERQHSQAVFTRVSFRPLSRDEVDRYVQSGEPLDKAGAYGIQGAGGGLIDALWGSYTNVVGLPLREVLAALHWLEA